MDDVPIRVDSAQAAFGGQATQPVDSTRAAFTHAPDASTVPDGPPGSRVPVRWGTKLGSVPIESYGEAVAGGAVPIGPEEWAEHLAQREAAAQDAIEQEQFGHVANQLEAAAVSAIKQVPFAGPGALAMESKAAKERQRHELAANPVSSGFGTALGIGVPIVASLFGGEAAEPALLANAAKAVSGGARAAEAIEGGAALARGAEGAAAAASPVVKAAQEGAQAAQGAQQAEAAQTAVREGMTAAQGAARVVSAPANAVTHAGEAVERFVAKTAVDLTGGEATTLAGKLGLKAAALGARGATEGAVYGLNDELGEQALSADPEFDAEKLRTAIGHGALLGAGLGIVGGAGGVLAHAALDKVAPIIGEAADHQLFRAIAGKGGTRADVRDVESIEGGWRGVVNTLKDKGVFKPGQDISEIADALEHVNPETGERIGVVHDAGERVGELAAEFDKAGIEGPRVADISQRLDDELGKAHLDPDLDRVQISRLEEVQSALRRRAERFAEKLTSAEAEAQAPAFLKTPEGKRVLADMTDADTQEILAGKVPKALRDAMVDEQRLSLSEARDFRKKIAGKARWNVVPGTGKVDEVGQLYQRASGIIESEVEKAIEKGGKGALEKLGPDGERILPDSLLSQYKQAKLEYQRLKVANRAAQKGALAKLSQAQVGLAGYAGLAAGAAIGAVHGSIPGAALSLASGVAAKLVKERGASTSGYLLDKLATMGTIQRVAAKADARIARGARAVMKGTTVAVRQPRHGLDGFASKRDAVLETEKDPQGHAARLTASVAGLAQHAPATASAFVSGALRASAYLASVAPRDKPRNPMQPHAGLIPPTEHERFVFGKQFDAVDNPQTVFAAAAAGTLIPQQKEALAVSHPKILAAYQKEVERELVKATVPLKADRVMAMSMLTGKPMSPAQMQQNFAMQQANFKQKDGAEQKTPAPGRAIPKASKLSTASQTALNKPFAP